MQIADTHTHLYFDAFDENRKTLLEANRKAGVSLQVQIGCDEISSLAALELAKTHEDMYCTLGLHPVDVWDFMQGKEPRRYPGFEDYTPKAKTFDEFSEWMDQTYQENKEHVVGFGETGLDLYHHNTPELLEQQLYSFKKHAELCQKHNKTLVIHSRNATDQTLQFLEENVKKGSLTGIFHCFCEDAKTALEIVEKHGLYIGIGGILTYKNAEETRQAVKEIPLEYLVTETDSPFLTPNSYRKTHKTNESRFLDEVIKLIADLKNMPAEETAETLYQNAKKAYLLS